MFDAHEIRMCEKQTNSIPMTSAPVSIAPNRIACCTLKAMLYAQDRNVVAKRRIESIDGSHKNYNESGHAVRSR